MSCSCCSSAPFAIIQRCQNRSVQLMSRETYLAGSACSSVKSAAPRLKFSVTHKIHLSMSVLTIEASINEPSAYPYLAARAAEYGSLLHRLHVEVNCRGKKAGNVVKTLRRSEGWTNRQLNALKIQLEGMNRAWKEGLTRRIRELAGRIVQLEKIIVKEKDLNLRHQRKRKLARWKDRLTRWQAELTTGRPRYCFGGRKLFKAQHQLKANGYNNHKQWLAVWRSARSESFMLIGKATDADGCGDCRLTIVQASDSELTALLKLRKLSREISTPHARPQDYIHIPVTFRYNIPQILAAVGAKHPMSYRFFKREGKWQVHLITHTPTMQQISDARNGALGIDLNPESIATALIKPDGNLGQVGCYKLARRRRTAEQTKNELGNIVALIVEQAVVAKVPVVIERLDFKQLQKELKSRGLNRRLSKFKFSKFEVMLRTRAAKHGIEIISANPAYTSVIGYFKFGYGNGLNRHESAAVAIARRIRRPKGNHFSERLRFRTQHPEAPNPKTLLPPATDGNRHPWKGWRKLGNLLAKITRPGKDRGRPSSAGGGITDDDDLDYSSPVTTVPQSDKPDLLETQPAKRSEPGVSRNV
jgi:IS605 OrfB family transposase